MELQKDTKVKYDNNVSSAWSLGIEGMDVKIGSVVGLSFEFLNFYRLYKVVEANKSTICLEWFDDQDSH